MSPEDGIDAGIKHFRDLAADCRRRGADRTRPVTAFVARLRGRQAERFADRLTAIKEGRRAGPWSR